VGIETLAVMTSGGDAPGMNACLRAVVRTAVAHGINVLGVRRAFEGLARGDLVPLGARDVGGIIQRGGTLLQTARFPEFERPEVQREALRQLGARGAGALVVIGGDGSLRGALALHRQGCAVAGIPASIDNDIHGTNIAIGVDTALNTIVEAIDKLRDTAASQTRAFIVETMGRQCGYLALVSGVICGAEIVLIPEQVTSAEEVTAAVADAYSRGKSHAIIVVAEGAKLNGAELKQRLDAMHTGFSFRATILGHIQRGGKPSAYDRLIAARFGVAAVDRLAAGERGFMTALQGRKIVPVPLEEACAQTRQPDMEYWRMARMLAR
jgi:6-phosphofructokinase 1